jgi:lysophospholipase L1-like esterase
MNRKKLMVLAFGLVVLLAAYFFANQVSLSEPIRVACVGDSLTQSTEYPYDLWNLLGNQSYSLRNFGAGSTTVSLQSETPYMNTSVFQDALTFQPNIVIIMLGTNDAQPSLHKFNTSFVGDYMKIVSAFQALSSDPEIWVMLPPPIISNQYGKMDSAYFEHTIIPSIEQAANEANVPIVDVFSAFANHEDYYRDGVHVNNKGAKLIADTIYPAIIT